MHTGWVSFAWTVYATSTALTLGVAGLLGTALFSLLGRFDRLGDRFELKFANLDQRFADIDQRFAQIDQRFADIDQRFARLEARLDRIEDRMRADKAEILERIDLLAERVTRLEAGRAS